MADADLRRRSPWRALLPALLFGVLLLAATLIRVSSGDRAPGALVLRGGVGLLALWAVLDGLRRGFGAVTYLGTGRGIDRLVGFAQAAIAVGAAVALLPNTVGFVEWVNSLVTGQT